MEEGWRTEESHYTLYYLILIGKKDRSNSKNSSTFIWKWTTDFILDFAKKNQR